MRHSDTLAALGAALVKAQAEIKAVPKESTNPHFKSKFASLDAITDAVKPSLSKHGLAVVQGATVPVSDAEGRLTAITIETMLIHSSGEWLVNSICLPVGTVAVKDKQGNVVGAEPTAQTAGAAVTYGRRYGLAALLAITNDEDDDGARASERSGATKAADIKSSPAGKGEPAAPEQTGGPNSSSKEPADKLMPFGKQATKRLGDIATGDLESTVKWCRETDPKKFASLISACESVIASREVFVGAGNNFDDFPAALQDTDDDLPF